MKPIIEVENLSKQYKLGTRQRYLSLRDSLADFGKNIFKKVPPQYQNSKSPNSQFPISQSHNLQSHNSFWALDDVSFKIEAGESVGIIGRNGAGKSTLLKILSRITPPTKGRALLRGRLASLLEVGTGFHPELSGRENVFMNGSILGLRRAEIAAKFDEIVAFSGVEQFIDTPLKNYSSGMQLRLAFAVAAHLEPEILIIDEVLAVGDAEFQKKCLGKMDEVSRSGRTVLFVSHNMSVVRHLCGQGMVLDKGRMAYLGKMDKAIQYYEQQFSLDDTAVWRNNVDKNPRILLQSIEIRDKNDILKTDFLSSEAVFVHFYLQAYENLDNVTLAFDLCKDSTVVFRSRHTDKGAGHRFKKGEYAHLVCEIPTWFLNNGFYEIKPMLSIHSVAALTQVYEIGLGFFISLDTTQSPFHAVLTAKNHPGAIFPMLDWSFH